MMDNKDYIFSIAMKQATKALGADPAYYGEEGNAEVERQLNKLGQSMDDIMKKGWSCNE